MPPLPDHLPVFDGVAHYVAAGSCSLVAGVDLVTAAIHYCVVHDIPKLLIDVRATYLQMPPTLFDRYWMAQDWAQAARGKLRAVMVARPEHIDPNRFGVKACIDAGLPCEVFTTVDEALAWLREPAPHASGASMR